MGTASGGTATQRDPTMGPLTRARCIGPSGRLKDRAGAEERLSKLARHWRANGARAARRSLPPVDKEHSPRDDSIAPG